MDITFSSIVEDLVNIGIQKGDLLNVKISMRSIGHVKGGAKTVIDALLAVVGEDGTIVTESFVKMHPLPLQEKYREAVDNQTPSYAGAIANTILEYPDVVRSQHPAQKFAAIGRLAEELMLKHTEQSYAYDVLRRMSEMGGKNINIGSRVKISDHGTCHVAVYKCNLYQRRQPVGVIYTDSDGKRKVFKRNWSGNCFDGFNNFFPYYKPAGAVLGEGKVGNSVAVLTDMAKTLEVETELLKQNPKFMFCKNPCCISCNLTWSFSDKKYIKFILSCISSLQFKPLLSWIKWDVVMVLRYKLWLLFYHEK